jgi:hypothetical protein
MLFMFQSRRHSIGTKFPKRFMSLIIENKRDNLIYIHIHIS